MWTKISILYVKNILTYNVSYFFVRTTSDVIFGREWYLFGTQW